MLWPVARSAWGLSGRSIQRTVARKAHCKREPDFHDKYGNIILLGGTVSCAAIWAYGATQIGVVWNLSPVGRVTPKDWREK